MMTCLTRFVYGAMMLCALSFNSIALAQDYQNDIPENVDGPVVTDLSQLPVIKKIQEKVEHWTSMDTDVALAQVRKYLREQNRGMPIDCKFSITKPIHKNYQGSETRSKIENELRKYGEPIVAFDQVDVWTDYPETAEGFQPNNPNDPEWKKFETELLPTIAEDFRHAYQGRSEPAGLKRLIINGFTRVCEDIRKYVIARFKADGGIVECVDLGSYQQVSTRMVENSLGSTTYTGIQSVTPVRAVLFYKLTYPHANGYQYRKIKLDSCRFEKEKVLKEKPLIETDQKAPVQKPNAPYVSKTDRQLRQEAREAARKEKQEYKEWERKQKEESKRYNEEQARKTQEVNRILQERAPKFVNPAPVGESEVRASTDNGQTMVTSYSKLHQQKWTNQSQFDVDEKKLDALLQKVKKGEEEFQQNMKKKYGDSYENELEEVRLDSKEPFTLISIPVDYALNSTELEGLVKLLQKRDYEWILGCLPRSLIRKDQNLVEDPVKTTLDCLIPRFQVKQKGPGEVRSISIPYPTIETVLKAVKNQCNVATGAKLSKGIGIQKAQILKHTPKVTTTDPSYIAGKLKNYPKEIEVTGGFSGKVIDLFTKKTVANAKTTIEVMDTAQSTQTDAQGGYVFPSIRLKGLKREVLGQHRLYYDNTVKITKILIGEVAAQDDLFLDPKRVTVSGTIDETSHPRFGSGIKGLRVTMTGYPQFSAETDSSGKYVIKNVPASLTEISVDDPTRGHQSKTFSVALDPEVTNSGKDASVVPNLTTLKGRLHTPKGKPADGLKVYVVGHPDISTVSDANGNYELRDIPASFDTLEIEADAEGVYSSKSEPMNTLVSYTDNHKDIEVKYNRSDISGRVYDVLTKRPISGAKIWVEGGKDKYFAVSDQYGYYEIRKVPDVARKLNIEANNAKYITRPRLIDPLPQSGVDVPNQDFRLIPRDYTVNKIVFVLTWNEKQYDLDSQLFFPNGVHLYYKTLGNKSTNDSGGGYLDRDDTGNSGRETTIVTLEGGKTKVPGNYRFLVFQYANQGLTFEQTGARVEIYRDGEFWQEVKPSSGRGRLWYVGNVTDSDVKIMDKFPAGDLYEQMDKLQAELKSNQARLEREAQIQSSLEAQLASLKPQQEEDENLLKVKEAQLLRLENPAAAGAVTGQPAFDPQAPVPQPVRDSLPNAPVVPVPAPAQAPAQVPTAQPGAPAAPTPKPETPRETMKRLKDEIAKLKAKIAKYPQLTEQRTKEIEAKKAEIERLKTQFATREQAIQGELEGLDRKLNEILEAYH